MKRLVAAAISLLLCYVVFSQTTSQTDGEWNDPGTWVGGTVPTSGAVIIATGHTVIYNANHGTNDGITISSLDVQGTGSLVWPFSDDAELDASFTLTVTGTVDIAASASITNGEGDLGVSIPGNPADRTHQFNIRNTLTNDGTFDMSGTTSARVVDVDFQTNTFNIAGGGATYTFWNVDIGGASQTKTITATSTITIENTVDIQADAILEMNGTQLDVGPDVGGAFELAGDGSTFTLTSGTVNIGGSASANSQFFIVDNDNCILNVDGGTLNIGNTTDVGSNGGFGRFRVNNTAATSFSFDMDGGVVNVAGNIDFQSATSEFTLDISAGTVNVGTGGYGNEADSEFLTGSITMTAGTLEFGEDLDLDVEPALSSGTTFSVGTNASETDNFQLDFTDGDDQWVLDGVTFTANGGLDIVASNELVIQGSSTVNIENDATATPGAALQIFGTLTLNTGTVNVAGAVTSSITADVVQVEDAGTLDIQDGTFNVIQGLTDGSQITGGQMFDVAGATTGTVNLGNGVGSTGTAILNIGTNIAAQGSPTEEELLRISADDGVFTVSSDGDLNVGGGNIGSLNIIADDNDTDANDFHFIVSGGTVDIAGTLDIRSGAGYQQTGGTVNVGTADSGGLNDLELGGNDPTAPTTFEVTGGTFTLGDGAANISIGNHNASPIFGSTTAYHEIEISGGTVNLNGRLQLEDDNARLILGGGATFNINPRGTSNLDVNDDMLWLRRGIVQITGAININFLNPHSGSGSGLAMEIEVEGAGTGNSITSSTSVSAPVDFTNVTWGFGDGTESSSGVDGFDIDFAAGHTAYGNWVINNPSGNGREVNFTSSGRSFSTGNVTITAGVLDLGTNDFDDVGTSTFLLDAGGTLRLDTDFPGTSASYTYTINTGSTIEYNGTTAVANAQVPDGTAFSNLTISGNATKTLNGAATVNSTLTLTDGILAAGTNLTVGAGSTVSRSAGSMTGDIQGSNAYTVEYTGSSKSIDVATDVEWSGDVTSKSLIINLDGGETLTINTTQLDLVDLTITQGTLTDASGSFVHDVTGNLTMNGFYTGSGTINITGGSATHTLTSTGTATFSNLTLDDAGFNTSGDLDVTITGTLTLTNGDLQVGSGQVTINSGASISGGSATSYVAFDGTNTAGGMTQTYASSTDSKTYPIGTNTEYTPGTIALTSATATGELTVVPVASGSAFTLDGSNIIDLDYHWLLTTDGNFADVVANHTYVYDDSDIRGVESSYLSARYNVSSPSWSNSDDTADGLDGVNDGTNTITLNGVDFVEGHLTAGEIDEFSGVITTYYLRSDLSQPLDWNDGTNWTNTDGGTTPINRTPGTNSPVVINRTVNVDDDGQNAGSINIEAAGIMILGENGSNAPSTGHTFGTVSGTGTLRIISDDTDNPTFPDENGGNWTSFLSASGGTVEYSGDGSYTLPSDVSSYYDLTITSTGSCSCTKTLGDVDLTIHNDLSISSGNTMTTAISDATNGNLTVGGDITISASNTLSFGGTNARTIAVTGGITNAGTFNVLAGSAAHALSTGGSFNSDGTTDFNDSGTTVDVTFTGTGNETVTIGASGSVDFNRLIVNKGTSQTPTLEVQATSGTFSISDTGDDVNETSIELQNGTLIISETATITVNTNGSWTIPSTAKLDINTGSPTIQMTGASATTLFLNGSIEVSTGTLTIGDRTDQSTVNSILYDGTTAEIIVDGGILNVGGAIRPNVSDGSAALTFSLSSGTVSIARNTSTAGLSMNDATNRAIADFSMDNASCSFTMSGGTLEIVRAESSDGKAVAISNSVTNTTVTGGTVNIMRDAGDAFSSNSTTQQNDIGISSAAPFWDLNIGDGDFPGDVGNANTNATTYQDLVVLNDLSIDLDNTDLAGDEGNFDFFRVDNGPADNADGMDLVLGGSLTISTTTTIQLNDDGTGGGITFNGSGLSGQTSPQVITTNGETLGDITINNTSGSVDLADNLTISGDWTYTAGTFNQSSNSVTMAGNVGLTGTTINGTPTFDDVTLSNTSDFTLAGASMTIASGGMLTVSDDVILDIGDNELIISEQSAGGITFSATPDATNMIRVSGNELAVGVTRTYPDAVTSNFLYPIGATINTTDYYLPAQIDLTAGGGAGSTATVKLIAQQHPLIENAQNALNVYWRVSETGFDDTQTASHTYTYGTTAADIIEGADDTNFLDAYNAGSPTFAWTSGSTSNVSAQVISFTDPGADNIAGDFTAGVSAAFPTITVFYTMRSGDWDNTTTGTTPWTFDDCDNVSPTEVTGQQPAATNPCVICSGETVTITTATGLAAASTQVDGQITSQVDDISTIGDIDGTGTILFSHTTTTTPVFGTLSGTFIGASGGTMNYGGTNSYTLPTETIYNDLIISNTATITFPNNISVNGDATFNGSTGVIDQAGFTISDADNGGTFTLGSGTTLEIDAAANFPSNFNTYTLAADSEVDYTFNASSTQTIQGGITYGNLTLNRTGGDPAPKQLNGNIVVMGNLVINRRAELQASTFDIELHGNWDIDSRNNTNFDPGTGTVTFAGGSSQIFDFTNSTGSETFYNLVINQSGTGTNLSFTSTDAVSITNNLTVTDETLDMGSLPLPVGGNVSIGSNGTFTTSSTVDIEGNLTNAGTFTVPGNVNLAGDFDNTGGTYTTTSNTLIFDDATSAQSLTGATTFNNLTVAKASGFDLTFNSAVTIEGTLAMQNEGNIVLSSGNLTIDDAGSLTGNAGGSTVSDFSVTRMIRTSGLDSDPMLVKNGEDDTQLDFVFPIGVDDSGNKYTPVSVAVTNDFFTGGSISVRSINGVATDQSIGGSATTLNRHFDFDIAGLSGGSSDFDIVFQYDDGDVQGSEPTYLSAYSERSVGDGWLESATGQANTSASTNQFGASTATLDASISFSSSINTEWIAGDNDLLFSRMYPFTTNCNPGPCDWNVAGNWSLETDGSLANGSVPTSNNAVTILASNAMQMNGFNGAQTSSIVINGALDFESTNSHALGEVTGTGTIQIDASGLDSYVDTGSGSTFFGSGGGTVEYLGDAAYNLPSVITEYENLTIGGTTADTHDKTLTVNTLVYGTLTLGNTDLENPSDLEFELRGSFPSSSGGTLNIDDGTFVFSNTASANLSSDLTFGTAGSLTLDNFGQKNLTGALDVENLTINSASGTFDAASNTINISGNWNNQAATNLLTNPGTITFDGGDAQQVDGDNTFAAANLTTTSTAVTVNSGTQTFTGAITLSSGTSLDIGSNTIRIGSTLDVDAGTFTGGSGTVVYTSTTDPETQLDPITVGTLEIDKGASTNTLDNDPLTISFTNLTITNGEYDGPGTALDAGGSIMISANGALDLTGITSSDVNGDFENNITLDFSGLSTMNVAGNFTNNGSFTAPTTVTLDGGSTQTLGGSSSVTFNALTINNSTGVNMTSSQTVSTLNLDDGILDLDLDDGNKSDDPVLTIDPSNAIATAGSFGAGTHIEGRISTGGTTFTAAYEFPIGDDGIYHAVTLDPDATADAFDVVSVVSGTVPGDMATDLGGTTLPGQSGPIEAFLTNLYWDINRSSGSGDVTVTLQLQASDGISMTDLSTIGIIRYNGSNWVSFDNPNLSSNAGSGTVTAVTSSFSEVGVSSDDVTENPLPVELISFHGEAEKNDVMLYWSTATELNNDYFEVQRSLDGLEYEVIGKVDGSGTANQLTNYNFKDSSPALGLNYYRLKQVDFDGASEYVGIVQVSNDFHRAGIVATIYPNPTKRDNLNLNILSGDDHTPILLEIIDISGQVYYRNQLDPSLNLNERILPTEEMSTGVYFIRIQQGFNYSEQKLIIE